MKTYNHLYQTKNQFRTFLEGIELDVSSTCLVRIHSCIHRDKEMDKLLAELKALLPNARMIGCSTTGVIYEGKIIKDACLVSISLFEHCEIETILLECLNEKGKIKSGKVLCEEVSGRLIRGRKGFLLVFLSLAYCRGFDFVDWMNRSTKGVQMLGGGAYLEDRRCHGDRNKAYVIEETHTSTTGISVAFVTGEKLSSSENYICGVESGGKTYQITKMNQHYLDKVDEKEGDEWYARMLGKKELLKNPVLSHAFPVVLEGEPQIPFFVDYEVGQSGKGKRKKKNRLNLYCELPKGRKISLGYFSPHKISDEMKEVYKELSVTPVESLFAYDCQARVHLLNDCAKWETGQFITTNISGALLSGEIVYRNGKNLYVNYAFVVAGLSENREARIALRGGDIRDVSALQQDNVQMINYLLTAGNRQLNEQLKVQQNNMRKAIFYNKALELNNQLSYLYEREIKNLDKIALFSLSNERMVKLFVGRKRLFGILKKIYHTVKEQIQQEISKEDALQIHIYSYESCALLLAADCRMKQELFVLLVKKTLEYLNSIRLEGVQLCYRSAVVFEEQEPLNRAETALEYGAQHNMSFIDYNQIKKKVLNAKEEIHMLKVLHEALEGERIIPYFQGIYDNRQEKIVLYESLMRIQDEQGNIYTPNQFLSIARENNLYEPLSVIMVRKVMELFLHKNVKVSINLNVRDIYDRTMIKVIFHYLNEAEHPENFVFELVETEEVTDYDFIKEFAEQLHERKAKIAIDDFGSGFSNLMHIIRIDADYLKIDGEIIRTICGDDKCRDFVEIINMWCQHQRKDVIAEFVENESIQETIQNMGIAFSQGYYFSKPHPWEQERIGR